MYTGISIYLHVYTYTDIHIHTGIYIIYTLYTYTITCILDCIFVGYCHYLIIVFTTEPVASRK